jgi:hypothetical protein
VSTPAVGKSVAPRATTKKIATTSFFFCKRFRNFPRSSCSNGRSTCVHTRRQNRGIGVSFDDRKIRRIAREDKKLATVSFFFFWGGGGGVPATFRHRVVWTVGQRAYKHIDMIGELVSVSMAGKSVTARTTANTHVGDATPLSQFWRAINFDTTEMHFAERPNTWGIPVGSRGSNVRQKIRNGTCKCDTFLQARRKV